MSSSVQFEVDSDVAVIRIDDGKANAISAALLGEMNETLDRAEKEARCVAIFGRSGTGRICLIRCVVVRRLLIGRAENAAVE